MKSRSIDLPRAPVSPFVKKVAAEWRPPSFAYHDPKALEAYSDHQRPHERLASAKGARGLIEERK